MKRFLSRERCLTLAKRFSRVSGTRHKVSVFKESAGEERGIWLEVAAIALAMAVGFSVLALDVEL